MYQFFPQIIILICVVAIIVVILRKLPQAAVLAKKKKLAKEQIAQISKQPKRGLGNFVLIIGQGLKLLGIRLKKFYLDILHGTIMYLRRLSRTRKEAKEDLKIAQKQLAHLAAKKPGPVPVKEEKEKVKKEIKKKENIQVLLDKASELVSDDKLPEAEKVFIEIAKADPKNAKAYRALGEIYLKQHNFGDAKAAFRQVKKLDPNDKEALAQLKKLGEATEEAVEKIEEK